MKKQILYGAALACACVLVFAAPQVGRTTATASTMDLTEQIGADYSGTFDVASGLKAEVEDGWVRGAFTGNADGVEYLDGIPFTGFKDDGTAYFDGVSDDGFCGIWEYDGKEYYLLNGKRDDITGTLLEASGSIYYLTDGIVDETVSRTTDINGKYRYIDRGRARTTAEIEAESGRIHHPSHFVLETDGEEWSGVLWCNDKTYAVLNGTTMEYRPAVSGNDGSLTVDMAVPFFGGSDLRVTEVNEALSVLPSKLLKEFINDGGIILVTDRHVGEKDDWIGITYSPWNIILILDDDLNNIPNCAVHEIGHYVDGKEGWISETADFKDIYNAEQSAFFKAFGNDIAENCADNTEYFAEAFRMYYSERNKLKDSCPKTESFITETVSQYLN